MKGPVLGTVALLAATEAATEAPAVPPGSVLLAAASVPQAPLSALFLSFMVYGFIGWAWESTVCSLLSDHRFSNSGFLLGPVCPIYGVGALTCWLSLRCVPSVVVLFFVSGTVCCVIEYLVGLGLEKSTGARFWDYDDKPMNIQGRVCLYGFLLFGAGATLVCRVVEPALLAAMAHVPGVALVAIALVLLALLLVDLVFAMASWRRLSSRLEEVRAQLQMRMNDSLGEASDRMLEAIPEGAVAAAGQAYERTKEASANLVAKLDPRAAVSSIGRPSVPEWLQEAAEKLVSRSGRRDLRFFNAFPRLRIPRYEGVISATHLKDRVRELFSRR
ncbi:putative ABC transporter permease [uncultured Parolsenella sp.]|uniref:putative ABC transporter permease n=1 Tax=uncultured Parolsenella sp. TaxID=2083008 RepID=UPI0027D9B16B|nr:putative ABC transporter permease [uncultured Parolsenella sp.]